MGRNLHSAVRRNMLQQSKKHNIKSKVGKDKELNIRNYPF